MKPVKEYRIDQMFDNSIWYLWQAGENIKTGSLMEIFSYLNALESKPSPELCGLCHGPKTDCVCHAETW